MSARPGRCSEMSAASLVPMMIWLSGSFAVLNAIRGPMLAWTSALTFAA